ncbi:MAG: tetratricopeptide repeat protein [Bacteroidetes bacterium]|nr:MAG: tetratricopeptide repeat protein [Bacteroidota bacterium]
MKRVYLLLSLLFCSSLLAAQYGQTEATPGSLAAAHIQDGQAAILAKDFDKAIRHFERALKDQPELIIANRLMGQCYMLLGKYPEAVNQYRQVLRADSSFSRYLYYELGDAYYKMGKSELALEYFRTFQELQAYPLEHFGLSGPHEVAEELVALDRLVGNIRACEHALDSVKFINITEIQHLDASINSKEDDYFPFLTNDQQQIYFTRKNERGDEDLLFSEKRQDRWRRAENLRNFNSEHPEGMSTLVRNGRQLFFTACQRDSVSGPCDIWEAIVDGATIQRISPLGAPINSEYWESQAAVSCDGSRLFFASNRPGGLGGTDIYMTKRQPNGGWSSPINLGAPVNTPEDEEAPFISNDGQTLYFSSTGHLGFGEQDVFMSWWDERLERWSMPINLGPPVNSPHRELGFYLSANGKTGFFASNRPGGLGGMDIYSFELNEKLFGEPITFVEGILKDSVLLTPIAGATVHINGRPPVVADEQGRFFLCAGSDEMLDLEVSVEAYRPYHNPFHIPPWENREAYPIELLLQPQLSFLAELEEEEKTRPTRENPREQDIKHTILFGFDSAELSEQEVSRMAALAESLEGRNIKRVEIVGFADDIGASTYNLQLSEDRAKHVAVFLLTRGIAVDDIHIEGKGTVLNERRREENRRVEIKITLIE